MNATVQGGFPRGLVSPGLAARTSRPIVQPSLTMRAEAAPIHGAGPKGKSAVRTALIIRFITSGADAVVFRSFVMIGSSRACVAACALLAASSAFAADLPRRTPPTDYYAPVAVPGFSWTGLYAGLNVGAGFGSFSQGSDQLFGKPTGVLGGVTLGYNQQIAPNFVLGAEADVDATNIRGAVSLPFFLYGGNARVSMLTTIRAAPAIRSTAPCSTSRAAWRSPP